jgi:magnesium transporter
MHTVSACNANQWIADVQPAQTTRWLHQPEALLWVDVEDPTQEDFDYLVREFNFHPLAIEDVQNAHQRPKIDVYEGHVFIVFYAIRYDAATFAAVVREVEVFVGANFVVTIHDGPLHELKDAHTRWKSNVRSIGSDKGALLYSILDSLLDNYFPVLDDVSERLDDLETLVFEDFNPDVLRALMQMKRDLLGLRKVVGPQRDVINVLLRGETDILPKEATPYLQDLYDHSLRVVEQVDTFREMVTTVAEGFLSVQSNNLNEVMKRLTVINVLFLPLAVLTGFFGMNFETLPFGSPYLLGIALFAMIAFPSALYLWLRRQGWG